MPKKKKKSRPSTDDASTASNSGGNRATPSPKKKSKDISSSTSKPLVKSDVISVKLLKGYSSLPSSSAVKRSLKYAPAVFLHEADANILDVVVGDRVFVISAVGSLDISSTNSNEINTNSPHGVKFMAVARIKVINDGGADRSRPQEASVAV